MAFTRPFCFLQAVKCSLIRFEMRRNSQRNSKSLFFSPTTLFALVALRRFHKKKTHCRFQWAEKDIDQLKMMKNKSSYPGQYMKYDDGTLTFTERNAMRRKLFVPLVRVLGAWVRVNIHRSLSNAGFLKRSFD